jgi:ATP-dependent Clp protease protease subunit
MEKAIAMLEEIKESIINAYELKTGLSRVKISHLMDAESWFNARKAVELGFADGILFMENESPSFEFEESEGIIFSRQAVTNSILQKLIQKEKPKGTRLSRWKSGFLLSPR